MVDDDGVARVIKSIGEDDSARVGGLDGRAGGASEVCPAVRTPGLAVQDRARAERAVRGLRHGRHPRAFPEFLTSCRLPDPFELFGLPLDSRHSARRRIHERGIDIERARRKFARGHYQWKQGPSRAGFDRDAIRPGHNREVDAYESRERRLADAEGWKGT